MGHWKQVGHGDASSQFFADTDYALEMGLSPLIFETFLYPFYHARYVWKELSIKCEKTQKTV